MQRRQFLQTLPAFAAKKRQRMIIFLIDGLGEDYIAASQMPVLNAWSRQGIRKTVSSVMPSVTNANNASIGCGCWPEQHGITANFFFDERTGKELYMETADLLLRPTLFEHHAKLGISSALLSAKKKTISLMSRGATIQLAAETPTAEWTERLGPAPPIYSAEINHWLLKAAVWILRNRPEIGLLYIHTTDYPMHMWPPQTPQSQQHLAALDAGLGEIAAAARDAAILLTADHGMNHKSGCWDLEKACAERGLKLRTAISAEQDKYLKHHRGFGGTAWVYLQSPNDESRAADMIAKLPGIEQVLSRADAARKFRTMASRIGDLVVLGDHDTAFGGLDASFLALPPEYRTHGGPAEARVPLLLFQASGAPRASYFQSNVNLTRWLVTPARA